MLDPIPAGLVARLGLYGRPVVVGPTNQALRCVPRGVGAIGNRRGGGPSRCGSNAAAVHCRNRSLRLARDDSYALQQRCAIGQHDLGLHERCAIEIGLRVQSEAKL